MKRTSKYIFILSCLVCFSSFAPLNSVALEPDVAPDAAGTIKNAVVKIYTVSNSPDFLNPWRMRGAHRSNGSGCIISGNRILTNAHVIADHTFIQVRLYGEAKRYKARVADVSHDADLAVLTVDDESFFEGITPLEFGELPETQQEVVVYGFPLGGDSLSITKGVLSRLEHNYYAHSSQYLLAGQIDAAINPGNSGGPVIVDGKIVGVVMQTLKGQQTENLGYMVPIPVVKHFFDDIADGAYDGFPYLGITTQPLENPDMKRKYGLSEEQTGLLVNRIFPGSPAAGKLERGDVLLTIEGAPVADDGTVEFRPKERSSYTYFVDRRQVGESISLDIFRKDAVQTISLELSKTQQEYRLVPGEQYETLPRYFIYGGIVFTPLTKNLLKQYGGNWPKTAPSDLVSELSSWVTEERQELVLALRLLPADVNQGYDDLFAWTVTEVDGQPFKDFDEFYRLVTDSEEPYLVLRDEDYFELVLDRQKAADSHESILETYRIEQDRSPDLREE